MKNYFKPHVVEFSYPGTSKCNDFYIRKLGFMRWLYYHDHYKSWDMKYNTCNYGTLTLATAGLNKLLSDARYNKALKNPKVVRKLW